MKRFFGRFWGAITLLLLAIGATAAFLIVDGLGWRADTSVIAGNASDADAAMRGVLYTMLWLVMVLFAPIFGLMGVVLGVWEAVSPARSAPGKADPASASS